MNIKRKIIFRHFSDLNLNIFAERLRIINWDSILADSDINKSLEAFISTISTMYCENFPLKTKFLTLNRIDKPWLSSELLRMVKLKSEYVRLYKLGVISKETNNRFKNLVTTKIRKAEYSYYLNKFKNFGNNTKQSWNILKKLTGANHGNKNSKGFFESNIYEEKLSKVQNFNRFFSNIGSVLDSRFDQNSFQPNFRYPNSFFFFPVSETEVDKLILNLKPVYSGINVIPVKMFKLMRHCFLYPLKILINNSFLNGIFPNCLKLARVTPIHKKGNLSDPSNFRPISSLSYISKILENCVKNRLMKFCEKYSLINSIQFGFQPNKSTCDALINLTETIYESLNNKAHLFSIMIDLRKAFDTVNHEILVKKLQCYGIRGTQLNWFRSYLSNRQCYVEVEGIRSDISFVNVGVPQGSILGPILFLFFINDVSNISNKFSTTLFADDTTVSLYDSTYDSLVTNVNFELNKFYTWTINNRLTLNVDKTLSIYISNLHISNDRQRSLMLGGESIKIVGTALFLGTYLDKDMNFISHIRHVCNKISKHIGILYKIKSKLTLKAKLSYYYAFVYPYLSYNVCVWGSTYPSHLRQLIVLQKRIIRIIADVPYSSHTRPLFSQFGILEFNDIYRLNLLTYVHKYLSKKILTFNNSRDQRDLFVIRPSFHRLSKTQHAFSFTGPTEWNKLPIGIRKIEKLHIFKKYLKAHFLSLY